ncbi:MAG: phosphoglycerate dehydrogenase [Leptospiraceae bacterium]|nr:phosphoglycerate dehydrogenase [Leptospiraceae bacterium]
MLSYPKNKINVLLLENISQDSYDMFHKDGFNVKLIKDAYEEEEMATAIKDVHILGIRSKTNITLKVLENAHRLLSVGCFCIGTNQVDLGLSQKNGIPVFNAPYSNTRSVAELVIAQIINLARQTGDRSKELHQGKWSKVSKNCYEIRGKTLGIVGYGHIGTQVSILAEALGMKILYYDIIVQMPIGNARAVGSYQELLENSDFVSFHVPGNSDTVNLFSEKEIQILKKDSYVINYSRGQVVNIEALAKAIRDDKIAGAAVDVFPEEPSSNSDPFHSPLQNLPNVILTPHIGGSTEEAQKNIALEVTTKLIKYINNGSTTTAVNFPNVELPLLKENYRILNVHKNLPGFLRDINTIVSDLGGNILSQYLGTSAEIGYLIMDIDKKLGDKVKEKIEEHPNTIKTRILY